MGVPRFWRNQQSRYNLVGVKCTSCGNIYFPPRSLCPGCRRLGKLEKFKLRGRGEVVTYTVIHTATEGFGDQAPYVMAIIRMEEGPQLTAQIADCDPTEVRIGMKVEAIFRKIHEDGAAGLIHYGYKFKRLEGGDAL